MTRKWGKEAPNKRKPNNEEPEIPNDLTYSGYFEMLRSLRKKNPTLARRMERFLEPELEKRNLFPRRRIPFAETTQGMRLRLILLPKNPHVSNDIEQLRRYLGIPKNHIRRSSEDPLWQDIDNQIKRGAMRNNIEIVLVGEWMYAHRYAAAGHDVFNGNRDGLLLPEPMVESAVVAAKVILSSSDSPEWLKNKAPCTSMSPMDWAVGIMVERHRLPAHIKRQLIAYVLTLDSDWVKNLSLLQPEIKYNDPKSKDPEGFSVTIRGIDEFINAADWEGIWKRYIEPRQIPLWELSGKGPQGRRGKDPKRLEGMMGLYIEMIDKNLSMQETINRYSGSPDNLDQETIRNRINDIRDLLTPLP